MAKGSIPRYVINFDEFADFFPLKADDSFNPNKARQRSKGFHIEASSNKAYIQTWVIPKNITLTGFKIACSRENEWFMDNFNLVIDSIGEKKDIFTDVYMKDFMEYKHFVCYMKVLKDSEIIFTYYNKSGTDKSVWFDIDYVSE